MIKDYQKAWAEAYTKLHIEIINSCWRVVSVVHSHPEEFAEVFRSMYGAEELGYLGEFLRKEAEANENDA